MLVDRSPFSDGILARPHGRMDVSIGCCNAAMCVIIAVSSRLSANLMVVAITVASLLSCYAVWYYIPYYHSGTNQSKGAFAAVHAWATVCLLLAFIRQQPAAGVEAFMLLFSTPIVAFVGCAVVSYRVAAIAAMPAADVARCGSPYKVELWARMKLRDADPDAVVFGQDSSDTAGHPSSDDCVLNLDVGIGRFSGCRVRSWRRDHARRCRYTVATVAPSRDRGCLLPRVWLAPVALSSPWQWLSHCPSPMRIGEWCVFDVGTTAGTMSA